MFYKNLLCTPLYCLVISFAAVSVPLTSFAQRIHYGISAGLNLSNLTSSFKGGFTTKYSSTGLLTGYSGGGFASFDLTRSFNIQTELNLSLKGGKSDADGVIGRLRSAYISLPAMLVYTVPRFRHFFFLAGPELDFLLSANRIVTDGLNTHSGNLKTEFKNLDAAIVIGEGFSLNHFTADLRYSVGVINIDKIVITDTRLMNRTVGLAVHYKFN